MLSPTLLVVSFGGAPWMPAFGAKHTTVEALFDIIYEPENSPGVGTVVFDNVVGTAVVDGLSRCGLILNYDGSRFLVAWPFGHWGIDDEELARTLVRKGDPAQSFDEPSILKPNSTRIVMKATYRGSVMEASGWFEYLSIASLLTHALIALIHSLLLVRYRTTSGAWDSILELLVLTQKSHPLPEPLLDNTSAGVRSFKTVKLLASVEAPQGRVTDVSGGEPGRAESCR
ncbi:hypothetical protein ACJZ2D_011528 [Fusarium nematophilum]